MPGITPQIPQGISSIMNIPPQPSSTPISPSVASMMARMRGPISGSSSLRCLRTTLNPAARASSRSVTNAWSSGAVIPVPGVIGTLKRLERPVIEEGFDELHVVSPEEPAA